MPGQDKQYLIGFAQLPDAATLDRTEDVIRRMGDIAMKQPGVQAAVAFPGLSINGFTNSSNAGIVFVTLTSFKEREAKGLSGEVVAQQLNQKFFAIQDAFIAMFPPPPVQGLGTTGGYKLQIEDRAGFGYEALDAATKAFLAKAQATPELAGLFTGFQVNVPQVQAGVDRTKARQLGVALALVLAPAHGRAGGVRLLGVHVAQGRARLLGLVELGRELAHGVIASEQGAQLGVGGIETAAV